MAGKLLAKRRENYSQELAKTAGILETRKLKSPEAEFIQPHTYIHTYIHTLFV